MDNNQQSSKPKSKSNSTPLRRHPLAGRDPNLTKPATEPKKSPNEPNLIKEKFKIPRHANGNKVRNLKDSLGLTLEECNLIVKSQEAELTELHESLEEAMNIKRYRFTDESYFDFPRFFDEPLRELWLKNFTFNGKRLTKLRKYEKMSGKELTFETLGIFVYMIRHLIRQADPVICSNKRFIYLRTTKKDKINKTKKANNTTTEMVNRTMKPKRSLLQARPTVEHESHAEPLPRSSIEGDSTAEIIAVEGVKEKEKEKEKVVTLVSTLDRRLAARTSLDYLVANIVLKGEFSNGAFTNRLSGLEEAIVALVYKSRTQCSTAWWDKHVGLNEQNRRKEFRAEFKRVAGANCRNALLDGSDYIISGLAAKELCIGHAYNFPDGCHFWCQCGCIGTRALDAIKPIDKDTQELLDDDKNEFMNQIKKWNSELKNNPDLKKSDLKFTSEHENENENENERDTFDRMNDDFGEAMDRPEPIYIECDWRRENYRMAEVEMRRVFTTIDFEDPLLRDDQIM